MSEVIQRKPKCGAFVRLTNEELVSLLRLPAGTEFRGMRVPGDQSGVIDLKFWHDGLPEVPEGTPYPFVLLRETEDDRIEWVTDEVPEPEVDNEADERHAAQVRAMVDRMGHLQSVEGMAEIREHACEIGRNLAERRTQIAFSKLSEACVMSSEESQRFCELGRRLKDGASIRTQPAGGSSQQVPPKGDGEAVPVSAG